MSNNNLKGQIAILIGAAGGIGRSIAKRLSEDGVSLVLTDRSSKDLEQLASTLPNPAVAVAVDLSSSDAVSKIVGAAKERFGAPNVLINNAAYNAPSDVLIMDADEKIWQQTFEINLYVPLRLTKAVLPAMISNGNGSIINIASGAGLFGDLSRVAYGASKAELINFTQYTATQYGKQGIRANVIAPGLMMHEALRAVIPQVMVETIQQSVLAPRPGEASDLNGIVALLAGQEARFVNGQVIQVDGGMTAHGSQFASLMRMGNQ